MGSGQGNLQKYRRQQMVITLPKFGHLAKISSLFPTNFLSVKTWPVKILDGKKFINMQWNVWVKFLYQPCSRVPKNGKK